VPLPGVLDDLSRILLIFSFPYAPMKVTKISLTKTQPSESESKKKKSHIGHGMSFLHVAPINTGA
jgi:hypothetical protein